MPDAFLYYNPKAIRGRQLAVCEEEMQQIIARHVGVGPNDVAIRRQKAKGRGSFDVDIILGSSIAVEFDERGRVGVDPEVAVDYMSSGPRIRAEIADLFLRYSFDQHQICEGKEVTGVKTLGIRPTLGIGRFSGGALETTSPAPDSSAIGL